MQDTSKPTIEIGSSVLVENSDGSKKVAIVKNIKIDLSCSDFNIYLLLSDGEDHWINAKGDSIDADTEISYHDSKIYTGIQNLLEFIEVGDLIEFRNGVKKQITFTSHMPLDLKPYEYICAFEGIETQTYMKDGRLNIDELESKYDIVSIFK